MAAKIVAKRTLMKVKIAETVASLDSVEKVRGREQMKATIAIIAENPIVHTLPGATVLRYFEPTRQWKPFSRCEHEAANKQVYTTRSQIPWPEEVSYLNESVVEHKHNSCEPPRPLLVPEEQLSNVAYVSNFRVAEAELPAFSISKKLWARK